MRSNTRSLALCALAVSGVLAVACDQPMTNENPDGGPNPGLDSSTPTGDDDGGGMTGDPDGGGTTGEDGSTPAGGCADDAAAYCARFEECDPVRFITAYENQAICERVRTAQCEDATAMTIPLTNGVADEAACESGQVASCEAFLNANAQPYPTACIPLPGDITDIEGSCFTDAQCGLGTVPSGDMRRMYCRPASGSFGTIECPRGQCVPAKPLGSSCNPANQGSSEFCDRWAGQACAQAYDTDTEEVTGDFECRQIEYGTLDAACHVGTDKQCAAGFRCDPENNHCMAVLDEGQACIPSRDLCDPRRGLSCRDLGDGDVCVGPEIAEIGEQCGTVTVGGETIQRNCSAYARCDSSVTPNVCVARVGLGETCTQDPDNCEPFLECDDATDKCVVVDMEAPSCP